MTWNGRIERKKVESAFFIPRTGPHALIGSPNDSEQANFEDLRFSQKNEFECAMTWLLSITRIKYAYTHEIFLAQVQCLLRSLENDTSIRESHILQSFCIWSRNFSTRYPFRWSIKVIKRIFIHQSDNLSSKSLSSAYTKEIVRT